MEFKTKFIDSLTKLAAIEEKDVRPYMEKLIYGPISSDTKDYQFCLEELAELKELSIFQNHLQFSGHFGSSVSYNGLLKWLINRSTDVGPINALNDLESYIENEKFEIQLIEIMLEANIDVEYHFNNGVSCVAPSRILNKQLAQRIENSSWGTMPYSNTSSVLILSHQLKKRHKPQGIKEKHKVESVALPFDLLMKTRLFISLARPTEFGIQAASSIIGIPDNVPIISSGISYGPSNYRAPGVSTNILEIEFEQANKLLNKFDQLDEKLQSRLLISLDRLNQFGSSISTEDKAIELRICLESIFLADGNKEQLSHRLATRAAIFNGQTMDDRRSIFKTVKKTYGITSHVIHNGKFNKKTDLTYLRKTAEIAKNSIIKLVNEGPVNWEDLELGGTTYNNT